jgi:hypothetical protein
MALDIALCLVVKMTPDQDVTDQVTVSLSTPDFALAEGPTPRPAPDVQDVHNFVAAQQKMH